MVTRHFFGLFFWDLKKKSTFVRFIFRNMFEFNLFVLNLYQ